MRPRDWVGANVDANHRLAYATGHVNLELDRTHDRLVDLLGDPRDVLATERVGRPAKTVTIATGVMCIVILRTRSLEN